MRRFQINTTLNGEPVLLTIESVGDPFISKQAFRVMKDTMWIADVESDGKCVVVAKNKKLFNEQDIQRLCKQIDKYKKGE